MVIAGIILGYSHLGYESNYICRLDTRDIRITYRTLDRCTISSK